MQSTLGSLCCGFSRDSSHYSGLPRSTLSKFHERRSSHTSLLHWGFSAARRQCFDVCMAYDSLLFNGYAGHKLGRVFGRNARLLFNSLLYNGRLAHTLGRVFGRNARLQFNSLLHNGRLAHTLGRVFGRNARLQFNSLLHNGRLAHTLERVFGPVACFQFNDLLLEHFCLSLFIYPVGLKGRFSFFEVGKRCLDSLQALALEVGDVGRCLLELVLLLSLLSVKSFVLRASEVLLSYGLLKALNSFICCSKLIPKPLVVGLDRLSNFTLMPCDFLDRLVVLLIH